MKKLMIAIDGSPTAADALTFGLELASRHGASAAVVHVVPAFDVVPAVAGYGLVGARAHTPFPNDFRMLEDATEQARAAGVPIETALLTGDTVDELVAYADSLDVDLIV